MKEVIERNIMRFGRNMAVPLIVYMTYMTVSAPIYYVLGIIKYGNPITNLWIFTYTFRNITQDLYFVAAPIAVVLGFYEIFRGLFLLARFAFFKLRTHSLN
jgi:hypothetical protein